MYPVAPFRRQYGAALVEFTIVSLPLLLCGLALPELAQWQLVRQVVHLALVEAGRAGATEHAQLAAMQVAFEQALRPLHAGLNPAGRIQATFKRIERLTGLPPWQIEVLQPGQDAFRDFADPGLPIAQTLGRPAIRNNFQTEQHARYRTLWPGGVGPRSGKTVFEANVLHLKLVYLHEPMLPWLRALLKKLGKTTGSYGQRAMAQGGMLPLTLELEMDMQSHAVNWSSRLPLPRAGGVPSSDALSTILPSAPLPPANGSLMGTPPAPAASTQVEQKNFLPGLSPRDDITGRQPDPACGVAICCEGV
jgi:hypothetical protein